MTDIRKVISVRLSPEKHKKFKVALAKDELTIQDWAEQLIDRYILGEIKVKGE